MNHPERSKEQNRKWWQQNTATVTSVAVYPCTAMHVDMYGTGRVVFGQMWRDTGSASKMSNDNPLHLLPIDPTKTFVMCNSLNNSQTMISTLEMCWQFDLQLIIPLPTCISIESPFNAPIISWENPQLRCVKYFSDSRTGHMISSWIFSKNCCRRYGSIE